MAEGLVGLWPKVSLPTNYPCIYLYILGDLENGQDDEMFSRLGSQALKVYIPGVWELQSC